MKTWGRINLTRKQTKCRKESNINPVNIKTTEMNNGNYNNTEYSKQVEKRRKNYELAYTFQ